MNANIEKLYQIAAKNDGRLILGLMSGTSLDGLDLALCKIKNSGKHTQFELIHFETVAYDITFREEIKSIFAKNIIDFKQLCVLNAKVAIKHAAIINSQLKKWNISSEQVDLIASHGQTVFHAPQGSPTESKEPNSTLQIGDGDHIAVLTGIITVSDFRQKHIAAGGQGAPLVIYGDYLLLSDEEEDRILMNIGGITNFTYLPAQHELNTLISTDVGPGNTLMNQYMQKYFGIDYDKDGKEAAKGKISPSLLQRLLKHPFFKQGFPKTTGPEDFNLDFLEKAKNESITENLSHQDVMATLAAFTAKGISIALHSVIPDSSKPSMYVSGGGMHNPVLMQEIQKLIPQLKIDSTATLGLDPDAKEAVLFAVLANETLAGKAIPFPKEVGAPPVCMGKISFPQ